jgi:hypothetical protein
VLVESVVESAVESVVESVVLTLCVLDTMCFGTVGTVYFGNLFDNICSFFLYTSVAGQLYIDVRTAEHPYGELRAVLNTKDGLRIR